MNVLFNPMQYRSPGPQEPKIELSCSYWRSYTTLHTARKRRSTFMGNNISVGYTRFCTASVRITPDSDFFTRAHYLIIAGMHAESLP